jgi:hypothetical protein
MNYTKVFNYLYDAHGLTLLNEEISEIVHVIEEAKKGEEVAAEWLTDNGFYQDDYEPSFRWFYGDLIKYDLDDFTVCFVDNWGIPKKQYTHELEELIYVLTGKKL